MNFPDDNCRKCGSKAKAKTDKPTPINNCGKCGHTWLEPIRIDTPTKE